ncbi:MAG: hypothetical protein H9847_01660 [Candidatus Anaerobiospirillum pullicola]|uniref:Uncharacterized protein n=1 Tax=Candidatus Anaerobiospirillum pullicola TaxID=2838451 RepID=A0A948WZ04_9GAMM|nr:hypothetical protein [Candidatus Anaerobiospirillum pullicola]
MPLPQGTPTHRDAHCPYSCYVVLCAARDHSLRSGVNQTLVLARAAAAGLLNTVLTATATATTTTTTTTPRT